DFRCVYRECTLNTYTVRDFTDCESFTDSASTTLDDDSFEELDTLARSLNDFHVQADSIPRTEFRKVCTKLVFRYFCNNVLHVFLSLSTDALAFVAFAAEHQSVCTPYGST